MIRPNSRRGFTLIELLIVVAIIAILAAIAVPNFLEAQTRAKVSRAKADLRTLATGIEMYTVDNNKLPYSESIQNSINMPPGGFPRVTGNVDRCGGLTSPVAYITSIPSDVFRHNMQNLDGSNNWDSAPIYYERPGFGFLNGVKLNTKPMLVPADAVGTSRTDGTGADTVINTLDLAPRPYVVYSLGPSLTPHVLNPDGGFFSRSRYNLNNRYDPSNGTISMGNVVRFPGGEEYP